MMRNRGIWRTLLCATVLAIAAIGLVYASGDNEGAQAGKKLVYGHITPGPDTWYKRVVDGLQLGAEKYGVELIVLNSDYDVQKELANIDSMITQGVDGLVMFSFNENGARIAAEKCKKAGIPVVVVDSAGAIFKQGVEVVAGVDFDWAKMGEMTMKLMVISPILAQSKSTLDACLNMAPAVPTTTTPGVPLLVRRRCAPRSR